MKKKSSWTVALATALTGAGAVAVSTSCVAPPPPPTLAVPAVVVCASGRADCDGDPKNGCESDLALPTSCGRCGTACAVGESCIDGECRREHRLEAGAGACAIRGGEVYCWGPPPGPADEFELSRDRTLPHRLEGLNDALQVRFNASMSAPVCATRRNGTVACWPETPATLKSLTGVRDAAAYGYEACAVTASGRLICGHEEAKVVPGVVDASAVVASDDGFFALRRDGHVAHVPLDEDGQVSPVGSIADAVDVAAAHHALCVLRRTGKVACSDITYGPETPPPPSQRPLVEVPGLSDAVAVDVGCAVRSSGEAVTWGAPGSAPRPVAGVKDAKRIACGAGFGCFERADGAVLCWGSRRSGRLGDGGEVTHVAPVPVEGITDAKTVVVDGGSCVLRRDGTVWCWGRSSSDQKRGVPGERVPGVEGVQSLTASAGRACAAAPGKPVTCFRAHLPFADVTTFEGLGDVTKAQAGWHFGGVALRSSGEVVLFDARPTGGTHRPAPLLLAGVRDAVDVAHSGHDVCVLHKGGIVACTDVRETFEKQPPSAPKLVEVGGVRDATQLTAGLEVCALRRGGAMSCFSAARAETKAKGAKKKEGLRYVAKDSRFGSLASVRRFEEAGLGGCVITAQMQVICQSQMGSALRGTGLAEPPPEDLPVKDVSSAVDVAMGSAHACAVLAGGRVMCWGSNDGDALGGGEAPTSVVPVEVPLGATR